MNFFSERVFNAVGKLPFTKAYGKFFDSSLWTVYFAGSFELGVILVEQGGDCRQVEYLTKALSY